MSVGLLAALKEISKEIGNGIKSAFPDFFKEIKSPMEASNVAETYKTDAKQNQNETGEEKSENHNFPYDKNGDLLSSITYESEGYTYKTDGKGNIVEASGDLRLEKGERDFNAQRRAGEEDRRKTDDGGHLIGSQFGGSGKSDNLVAMKRELNQNPGEYYKLEKTWADALKDGKAVYVEIEPRYDGESKRPTSFAVTYKIDGEKSKKVLDNN